MFTQPTAGPPAPTDVYGEVKDSASGPDPDPFRATVALNCKGKSWDRVPIHLNQGFSVVTDPCMLVIYG